MDKNEPGTEVSEEATRESLIAISYTAPEKETAATHANEKEIKEDVLGAVQVDRDDKYRSKLISISYQSPDPKPLPVHPGENRD